MQKHPSQYPTLDIVLACDIHFNHQAVGTPQTEQDGNTNEQPETGDVPEFLSVEIW